MGTSLIIKENLKVKVHNNRFLKYEMNVLYSYGVKYFLYTSIFEQNFQGNLRVGKEHEKKHISTLTVPIFVLRIHILSSKVIIIQVD